MRAMPFSDSLQYPASCMHICLSLHACIRSVVIQFLSYEGVVTSNGAGPLPLGTVSTDIGVFENGAGLVGNSMQLQGLHAR